MYPHTKRPDGDNLEKFLNDALNGVVWDDDARIVWMLRTKTYTDEKEGSTILYVRQLEDAPPDYEAILADIKDHITIEAA